MLNKEVKKVIIVQLILFILLIVLNLSFNSLVYNQYKNEIIKNNMYIISNLIQNHPELETEIIDSINSNKGSYELAKDTMDKYGLLEKGNIGYLVNIENIKNKIYTYNLIFFSLLFLAVSLSYIIFIKKQIKKINSIDNYMNNILNGDYSLDIREYEEGYISNLKNDIYKITVRLKEQRDLSKKDKKNLEEVLSDISHQIKTPLTSMYVINDLLSNENLKPEMRKEILNKNNRQLERIEWLVTSLLKMSRLDSGTVILKKEDIILEKLINNALEPLLIPIELKNQKITITGDYDIQITADYDWTLEAIINIIKNAYEHTSDGGKISISYNENPLYTQLIIKDNGEGIEKDDLKHIFERFYKGKNNNKESIGIGLNMAKKIIDMQNGQISVESKLNEGTAFIIKFYKISG